jgi:hypothetical protein
MAVPQLLADLGIFDRMEVAPPFRFRLEKGPGEMWARQLAWGTELLAIVV